MRYRECSTVLLKAPHVRHQAGRAWTFLCQGSRDIDVRFAFTPLGVKDANRDQRFWKKPSLLRPLGAGKVSGERAGSTAMADVPTRQLQIWIDQMNAGEGSARDLLLGQACARLERVARKIRHDFP